MEALLHYVWKHRFFPSSPLKTTMGDNIEIIDPGLHNYNAGPDFFNAKVRINGTLWVGNVEMHIKASDWLRHGHNRDNAYNNIILHVVEVADTEIMTADGKRPPQLVLHIPDKVQESYNRLSQTEDYPRCWPIIPSLSTMMVHNWMSALLAERLHERAQQCLDRLENAQGDWERTAFITLARNFGFGINGDAFEAWARKFPLHAAAKHRDNLFQLEALFLGSAGLLEHNAIPPSAQEAAERDEYLQQLRKEWVYLAHKFQLPPAMEAHRWRYLRLRPQNFPHLRIVQLANLYYKQTARLSTFLQTTSREGLHQAFETGATNYWQTHYLFGIPNDKNEKRLSPASRDLLIINTVCPLLYAHGMSHNDEHEQERAIELMEQLRPERNFIIRQWQQCGVSVESAADSQALIQLKRMYCDRHDCLRCRFGFEYLKWTL